MSFNWQEYVELAFVLAGRKGRATQEARLRTAVSRAYYGVFCMAREFAEMAGFFRPSRSGKDHSELRNAYAARPELASRRIAAGLERLHNRRKRCDYEPKVHGLEAECEYALRLAQDIQRGLAELQGPKLQ